MAALYWQSNPASLSLYLKTFALATDYNVFKKIKFQAFEFEDFALL